MYTLIPLGKLQKSTWNGVDNWIKTFLFLSSVWVFFVTGVACEIECRNSVDIPYAGVKVILHEQTEYQRKFQDVVAPFPGEEQISSLKRPLLQ